MKVTDLTRPEMHKVDVALLGRLQERAKTGPPEPALDAFIPELETVGKALDAHVEGKAVEDAKRRAALVWLEEADDEVDYRARNVYWFLSSAAQRRTGPWAAAAGAIRDAGFPDGLSHLDDWIPTENQACRSAIAVLEAPDHTETLTGIEFPGDWTQKWETALDESDKAFAEVKAAREARGTHVEGGLDAEADFADLVGRLKRYVQSRAKRSDKARIAEGKALLEPLTSALEKAARERAARETRKKNAAEAKKEGNDGKPNG